MEVSATRRAKLIREMNRDRELHERGHYVVSERKLIESIVDIIQNQRELEVPSEFDPVTPEVNEVLANMQG
jgi:hypothetical protein